MSQNPTPSMEPLSVGNVVSAGLRIYRDHFKSYFGVAILATLWSLLPFLVLIPVPLFFIYAQANSSNFLLLIPLWLLLIFYCSAKSIMNTAIISRLVFGELANQPETVREARRILTPKMWTFLKAFLLLFLIGIGVWLGFSLVFGIAFAIIGAVVSSVQQNFVVIAILGLIGIVIFGFALSYTMGFFTRFFIIDMPLTVEKNLNASQTLGRSWKLTKGYVGRIFLILTVGVLITIPVAIIVQIIVGILQFVLQLNIPIEPTEPSFLVLSYLVGYILSLLSNVFLLPFWSAIKAVIYYDLRTRREGMGLELRKREI